MKPIKSCFQKDLISKKHTSIGRVGYNLDVTFWLPKNPHQTDKTTKRYLSILYICVCDTYTDNLYIYIFHLIMFENRGE